MREMNSPLVRLLGLLSLVLRLRQRSLRRSLRPESRSGTRHPDAGLIRDWDPIRVSGCKLGKIWSELEMMGKLVCGGERLPASAAAADLAMDSRSVIE